MADKMCTVEGCDKPRYKTYFKCEEHTRVDRAEKGKAKAAPVKNAEPEAPKVVEPTRATNPPALETKKEEPTAAVEVKEPAREQGETNYLYELQDLGQRVGLEPGAEVAAVLYGFLVGKGVL